MLGLLRRYTVSINSSSVHMNNLTLGFSYWWLSSHWRKPLFPLSYRLILSVTQFIVCHAAPGHFPDFCRLNFVPLAMMHLPRSEPLNSPTQCLEETVMWGYLGSCMIYDLFCTVSKLWILSDGDHHIINVHDFLEIVIETVIISMRFCGPGKCANLISNVICCVWSIIEL